jgi:hypothetical protein
VEASTGETQEARGDRSRSEEVTGHRIVVGQVVADDRHAEDVLCESGVSRDSACGGGDGVPQGASGGPVLGVRGSRRHSLSAVGGVGEESEHSGQTRRGVDAREANSNVMDVTGARSSVHLL